MQIQIKSLYSQLKTRESVSRGLSTEAVLLADDPDEQKPEPNVPASEHQEGGAAVQELPVVAERSDKSNRNGRRIPLPGQVESGRDNTKRPSPPGTQRFEPQNRGAYPRDDFVEFVEDSIFTPMKKRHGKSTKKSRGKQDSSSDSDSDLAEEHERLLQEVNLVLLQCTQSATSLVSTLAAESFSWTNSTRLDSVALTAASDVAKSRVEGLLKIFDEAKTTSGKVKGVKIGRGKVMDLSDSLGKKKGKKKDKAHDDDFPVYGDPFQAIDIGPGAYEIPNDNFGPYPDVPVGEATLPTIKPAYRKDVVQDDLQTRFGFEPAWETDPRQMDPRQMDSQQIDPHDEIPDLDDIVGDLLRRWTIDDEQG
jgi:hypothetical protein